MSRSPRTVRAASARPKQALEVFQENLELTDTEWFQRIFFDR
ncbi:hypothetical protein [Bowdeniella nasicola]|nr:hypothetical protein [Bowdeniella nasicola]